MHTIRFTHTLSAHQESLHSLQKGDELLCLSGHICVRSAGMPVDAWGPETLHWQLRPAQQWRAPCPMVVTMVSLEQQSSVVHRTTETAKVPMQKSRSDPWGRRLWQGGLSALRLLRSSAF